MISLTVISECRVQTKITEKKTALKTQLNTAPVRRPNKFWVIQVIPRLKIKKLVLKIA